jgi:ABC-2 type transport system ATP-binding protein/ribosome-dependent ATPase
MTTSHTDDGTGPALEAVDLTKRFGRFTAVEDASITVRAGEVVGLLGANGAGKTTLVRMVLGLLRPTAGTVRLFGAAPSLETRRRLGYVPQGLGLYDDLTVRENLAFVAAAFGSRRREPRAAGDDRLVGRLPLGVQRRVAFEAALEHEPDLLVLDEPTSGVGPLARARLWDTIRQAAEVGTAVLVTTHHMDEAEQCDRLVVMAAGQVRAAGRVGAIVGDERAVEVRAERWQDAFAALDAAGMRLTLSGRALRLPGEELDRVRRALADHGVPAELSLVPATLEEAFVRLAAPAGTA